MMENNNTTSKKKDRSIAWIIVIGDRKSVV